MKVIVKKFSVNIKSWSNQEVAKFLLDVIKPKDNKTKIWRLVEDQVNQIKDKLGKAPTMPNSFEGIYQQYKEVNLESNKDSSNNDNKSKKLLDDFIKDHGNNKDSFRIFDRENKIIVDYDPTEGNGTLETGTFKDIKLDGDMKQSFKVSYAGEGELNADFKYLKRLSWKAYNLVMDAFKAFKGTNYKTMDLSVTFAI